MGAEKFGEIVMRECARERKRARGRKEIDTKEGERNERGVNGFKGVLGGEWVCRCQLERERECLRG